jgi:hypothetical protein
MAAAIAGRVSPMPNTTEVPSKVHVPLPTYRTKTRIGDPSPPGLERLHRALNDLRGSYDDLIELKDEKISSTQVARLVNRTYDVFHGPSIGAKDKECSLQDSANLANWMLKLQSHDDNPFDALLPALHVLSKDKDEGFCVTQQSLSENEPEKLTSTRRSSKVCTGPSSSIGEDNTTMFTNDDTFLTDEELTSQHAIIEAVESGQNSHFFGKLTLTLT